MKTKWLSLSEALSLINRASCGLTAHTRTYTHTHKETDLSSVAITVNKTHPVLWFYVSYPRLSQLAKLTHTWRKGDRKKTTKAVLLGKFETKEAHISL